MITLVCGSSTVVINRLASQDSRFSKGLFSLASMLTSAGCRLGACIGDPFIRGVLRIETVSKAEADQVRDFFVYCTRFGTNSFTINSDKSDLGVGVGSTIQDCYLDLATSTDTIVSRSGSFNKYLVLIPYFTLNMNTNVTTFTDVDGKVYDLLVINGLTWFKQNYNRSVANSYAYDNNDANANDGYGRLYTWDDAVANAPTGYHLASESDWNNLSAFLGGDLVSAGHLKSTDGWNPPSSSDDSVGFVMRPNGYREPGGAYVGRGYYGYYWTSGLFSPTAGANRVGVYTTEELFPSGTGKTYYISARYVKD